MVSLMINGRRNFFYGRFWKLRFRNFFHVNLTDVYRCSSSCDSQAMGASNKCSYFLLLFTSGLSLNGSIGLQLGVDSITSNNFTAESVVSAGCVDIR